jgi:hypothetical protein
MLGKYNYIFWNTPREDTICKYRRVWVDYINKDFGELWYVDVDWIQLARNKIKIARLLKHGTNTSGCYYDLFIHILRRLITVLHCYMLNRSAIFPQLYPCGNSLYVTSSLTRRWVCLLLNMLGLSSSVVFLGGEVRLNSLGTSATNWPIVLAPDDR